MYISNPISVGSVILGGTNPIRLQSMTNTNTLDTKASVAQCIRIIEAGADFVRLTAQGVREAQNLEPHARRSLTPQPRDSWPTTVCWNPKERCGC